ncbi:MAG TPA: efflux RND transporter periplasmic adaptor subunit, partial [Candidatus Udaeobacter sp.]|nr:efflux RND transporter periplasmic adaptor subunit [Candidatus Udaeobacter sp.]
MNRSMLWLLVPLLIGGMSCSRPPDSAEKAAAAAPGSNTVQLCEHQVPADLCTQCTPALIPAFKSQGDWCAEHGVPESQCRLCHPDLTFTAQATKDWCKEHAIAESKCTKCHPNLVAGFIAAGDYCREHGYPASACPKCHPELVTAAGEEPPVFPEPGTKVVLASAQTGRDAGIATQRIGTRRFARTLEVVGQLEFNHNRHAELSARSEALVAEVKVDIGDQVQANQALIALVSSAVGSEQARLSAVETRLETARSAVERERQLAENGVSPKRTLEQAQVELAAAQAEYDAAAASLDAAGAAPGGTGGRYVLRAPFAGTVVARDAVV